MVENVDVVVTKDGKEVDLEDVDEDATHRLEVAVTVTHTETVPITELIFARQDPAISTKTRFLI